MAATRIERERRRRRKAPPPPSLRLRGLPAACSGGGEGEVPGRIASTAGLARLRPSRFGERRKGWL